MQANSFFDRIRDYFGFSHREARGFLVLLGLIFLILLLPLFFRWLTYEPAAVREADQRMLDSLLARIPLPDKPVAGNSAFDPSFSGAGKKAQAAERFAFDPNTVSVADWQRMGVPRWLAERIDRYRQKGGQFRRKEDLRRIYDFPPQLYTELEPFIVLKSAGVSPAFSGREEVQERQAVNRSWERPARPEQQPFDINTADTTQLIRLRGIGSRLAQRILKFRDALGGFVSPEQFDQIYGLDSTARQALHQYARIQTPVRPIPINSATAEELDRHPYLSRRQPTLLVRYREQHGAYRSVDDLRNIRVLDEETIERIRGYLVF